MRFTKETFGKIDSELNAIRGNKRALQRVAIAAMLLLAILSITVFSGIFSSTAFHKSTFETLDRQKGDIALLAASSTSASALISMIPDDTCTPIANQLADLSGYFLLAMSMLYLEKFLLTTIAYIYFSWVVPISMGLMIWQMLCPGGTRRKEAAVRVLLFGMVLVLVIPISTRICNKIEETYHSSIQETIDQAVQPEATEETAEEKSFWDKIGDAANSVVNGVGDAVEWAKTILNRFVEAVAVVLVTSCVIPLLVLLCMLGTVKMLFGVNIRLRRPFRPSPSLLEEDS